MASKTFLVCAVSLVIFCFFSLEENSDSSSEYVRIHGHSTVLKETQSRKILAALKEKKEAINAGLHRSPATGGNSKDLLRKVPSGPDPLHHNGGSPKPRTP